MPLIKKIVYFLILILPGCGFQPLFSPPLTTPPPISLKITGGEPYTIYRITKSLEHQLSSLLIEEKGWQIILKLEENFSTIGYSSDGSPLRAHGLLRGSLQIIKNSTECYKTTLDAVSSYSTAHENEFMNTTTLENTRNNLADTLVRRVIQEIFLYFKKNNFESFHLKIDSGIS